MIKKSNEEITVSLTYSWTFNEKEWDLTKEHWEEIKKNPRIVFGYDHITAWHNMNDVCYPELAECNVKRSS